MALAEVSCSAIVSGEEGSCKVRDEDASEAWEAVLKASLRFYTS